MSDIEREEFEQAFLNQYTDFERFENGEYMDDFLQQSWIGWQASREAVESVPDMWRDVDYEVPEHAQEVILVLGEKVVHGAWIGGMFWHNNRKVEATKWMPLPQPPNQEGQANENHI